LNGGLDQHWRRVGVLGGSFDPVHYGHLLAAQDAYERLQLDAVVFLPSFQSPLKDRQPGLGPDLRHELLRLALGSDPRFHLSDWELSRGQTSYTIDSARHFRTFWPQAELWWIIGADQAAQLGQWRSIAELGTLLRFAAVGRPGYAAAEQIAAPEGVVVDWIAPERFLASSSELRERARSGLPLEFFTPPPVAATIQARQLYH
jgi:nicotinate-nucleotide adenylyltransferase